jgi:hypothetical protein
MEWGPGNLPLVPNLKNDGKIKDLKRALEPLAKRTIV